MNFKKLLAGISAFAIMLTAAAIPGYSTQLLPINTDITVSAEDTDTNEYNITWELSSEGVLKISGTGDMKDYGAESGEELSPFYNKEDIKSVIIEKGVTSIGSYAFCGCKNIESVTISDTVARIGKRAFQQCAKLNGVVIPAGLSKIEDGAFYSCKALDSISIPETVTSFGAGAFFNTPYYDKYEDENGICIFPNGVLITGDNESAELTVPPEIKVIAGAAFWDSAGKTAVINADCYINELAFYNCDSLESVNIAGKCSIDSYAFYNCEKLKNVIFSGGCSVEKGAIYRCDALESVDINADCDFKTCAFYASPALKTVNINSGCTIRESAFYRCSALTSVNIDADCDIEKSAFNQCDALTSVHVNSSKINPFMFLQCNSLTDFTYKRQPLTYSISDNKDNKANIAKVDTVDSYDIEYDTFDNVTAYGFFGKLDRLQETADPSGKIYAVYGGDDRFYVIPEDAGSNSFEITNEGFTFGGAVIGDDGFLYAMWGRSIPNEVISQSLEQENIVICKYDMSGILVSSLGLKVKDTEAQFPFDSGNANLRYKNGVLGVFFNTEWLESKTNDGKNHQGSEFAAIQADTMTLLDFSTWEGSHSFGVSLIETDFGFAGVQKGDANPRSICINRYLVDSSGKFEFNNKTYDDVFNASGQYAESGSHQNDTHYYMGGFAMSKSTYAVTGKSERFYTSGNYASSGLKTDVYDVFVKISDQSFFDSAAADCAGEDRIDKATGKAVNKNVIWLTECNANEKAGNVKIVTLEDGSYCVLWEKFTDNMFDSIRYVIMDECGNILRKETGIYSARLSNTTIQPVVQGSKLIWAVAYADTDKINWYSVDINEFSDIPDKYQKLKEYISENNINVSLITGNHGTCGESAYWLYDEENASLHICGTGKIYISVTESPWTKFMGNVKKVFIDEGIDTIDDNVFSDFTALENVSLPKSLKKIGRMSFNYCSSLKEIILPENLEEIGEYSFLDCNKLERVTALNKNTKIGEFSLGYIYKNNDAPADLKFYGYTGSEFEAYAKKLKFEFFDLENPAPVTTTAVTEITTTTTTVSVPETSSATTSVSTAIMTAATTTTTVETAAETTVSAAPAVTETTAVTTAAVTTSKAVTAAATTSKATETTTALITTTSALMTTTMIPVTTTAVVSTSVTTTIIPVTTAVKTTITTKVTTSIPVTTKITAGSSAVSTAELPSTAETTITTVMIPVTTSEITTATEMPGTTEETVTTTLPVTTASDIASSTETTIVVTVPSETTTTVPETTAETDMVTVTTTEITVTTTVPVTTTEAAETLTPETTTSITTVIIPVTTTSTSVTTVPAATTTAVTTSTTTAVTEKPVLRGDISGNGKIDLYDAIEIAKYIIGKRKFTDKEMKIADFTGNGKVDLYDAIGIAEYMLKNK